MASIPGMELKINMAAQMSNAELAEAIEYAYLRAGGGNDLEKAWYLHMDKLMEVQLGRAMACSADTSNPRVDGTDGKQRR